MAKFVSALAADGAIDETTLSTTELQTIYGPFTQRINESLAKQEQVMGQVQVRITSSFVLILYVHGLDPLYIATKSKSSRRLQSVVITGLPVRVDAM